MTQLLIQGLSSYLKHTKRGKACWKFSLLMRHCAKYSVSFIGRQRGIPRLVFFFFPAFSKCMVENYEALLGIRKNIYWVSEESKPSKTKKSTM